MNRRNKVWRVVRARYLLPLLVLVLAAGLLLRHSRGLQTPRFHMPSAGEISRSPAAQRLRAGAAGANLIIILMDSARASHFTSFGHERDTTPNIAEFFDDSILFTEAYSAAANTKAAVASIFTSQFPDTHGTISLPWPMTAEAATLAECMRTGGCATAAFVANPVLARSFGFDRGFDSFDEVFARAHSRDVVDGALVVKATVDWIRAHEDQRFFAYVHFLEPHSPYPSPAAFRERIAGRDSRGRLRTDQQLRYDASLAYVDSLVGQLLKEMDALDLIDESVVVVLADHGEAFGEHGVFGHTTTVYREMVHVPVAVRLPERCGASPQRRSEIFCPTDLMPTLLDLLQIQPPKTMQGRSRLALLAGEAEEIPGFAVTRARGGDASGGKEDSREVSYALRLPRYTLILGDRGRQVELYDRDADPDEQDNIAPQRRDVVKNLHKQFRAWAATQRGRPVVLPGGRAYVARSRDPKINEKTREQLRSLGYLK